MSKIETKERTYDEGLIIYREITKVITHDDGRVETKVQTFEIGRRTNHSDYWRAHYASEDDEVPVEKTKERFLMEKCVEEVARIANSFDENIKLAYKDEKRTANDPTERVVLLDPDLAISEGEMGQKVDVFSGEILLGTALRKQSRHTKQAYREHLKIAYDEQAPVVDRAASMLYLAMEADAACEHIKSEAPGFTEYAHSRARKYVSDVGSSVLQDEFLQDEVDPGHKFAAIMREFDTLGSQPLDYGDFGRVVDDIVGQARNLPNAESRLEAARQIAHRYLIQMQGNFQPTPMPGGPPQDGDQNGEKQPGEGEPQPGEGSGGPGDQPVDMELLKELLSSAEMMGKPSDADKESKGKSLASGSGMNQPKTPREILDEAKIGDAENVPTIFTDKVASNLDEHSAKKLYDLDCRDVREVSEAIEESLEILNRPEACWDEYSLRNGEIDEGALHKLIDESDNVFYRVETLPRMRIQVGLVLDESGSMACYAVNSDGEIKPDRAKSEAFGYDFHLNRSGVARKLATAFVEGTKNIDGVSLGVYGHAGPRPKCRVYKYLNGFSSEDEHYRVAHITERLHNYDGHAILRAGQDMLEDDGDFDRRIMFIISDGEPSVTSYSGQRAKKHIAGVVNHLNEHGLETYCIGVDNAFPPHDGELMYGKDRVLILPRFDLSEVAMIMSSFLEEISRGN